ncbi:MAG TPA: DNA primase [Patescibacteria group bacterium]|nr:DNA primase [Patescibacteria group bacterium]
MDEVALIREKIDIVSLIGETVQLKKTGRNFKGLCPFHGEKSPSFIVSPERQIWHCFGCQAGGDAYSFVMEQEKIEFPEALRLLAKRVGVTLQNRGISTGLAAKKERLYEANSLAVEFYHYLLTKHAAGKKALEYVQGRKINDKVIETFRLGFAPNQRDSLVNYLMKKKKFTAEELLDAGLAVQYGRQLRDFFWNRLIFPLYDHRENIVGFSGRILTVQSNGPKYINTRETLIYHKGETFFGIQVTKESIKKEKQAILVEGEFDVISCFQAGVTNVLAVKGTALTPMQVNLLARYADKITICFDGDKAGQEAMKRSIPIIDQKNLKTTVAVIPGSKDPDEAIKTNELAFKQALKKDISVYDYLFDQAISSADPDSAEGKRMIAGTFLPVLASIGNLIIREHYLKKLSKAIDTSEDNLQKEIERSVMPEQAKVVSEAVAEKRTREEVLEEYLVSLILQSEDPKSTLEKSVLVLSNSMAKERAYQKIFSFLLDYSTAAKGVFDQAQFGTQLSAELLHAYNKSLLFPLPKLSKEMYLAEVQKTAEQLRELYLRSKIKILSEEMKRKEAEGKMEELEQLQKEFIEATTILQNEGNSRN